MDAPPLRDRPAAGPAAPAEPLLLSRFLPYRLSVLANLASAALAAQYSRRFGLGIPEWRVLAVVANEPGLSAAEVVERTAMDKVAVSRAVAALRRDGRLEQRRDAADRRRTRLVLSPAGAAVYAEVVPLARRFERELLESLPAADGEALDRALGMLSARLRDRSPAPDPGVTTGG